MKTAVCCIAKNEEKHVGEWIAYHISIGFDAVIVYDNGSEDGTAHIVRKFARNFDVRLIGWNVTDGHWQNMAYFNAILRLHAEFDWILFIDVDEFLFLSSNDMSLVAFLSRFGADVGQISINWAMFGSSGYDIPPEGLVIENFTRRLALDHSSNAHTKAFVKPAKTIGISNCHSFVVEGRSVDAFGDDVSWLEDLGAGILNRRPGNSSVRINHYWTKSRHEFQEKIKKGYGDKTRRSVKEFFDFDVDCVFEDVSAGVHGNSVREVLGMLDSPDVHERSPMRGTTKQMEALEASTLKIVDFAIGDVLCSLPALYQRAETDALRLWFQNSQIRQLWAGPQVEMLSGEPDGGVTVDIADSHRFFAASGLHMIQAWFWRLGLAVPREIPKIQINMKFHDSVDVLISPFSASGSLGGKSKIWRYDGWNRVIDALLGAGLTVGVCGVFTEGANPRSFDQRFWGDRPIIELNALPLVDLAGHLSSVRCLVSVDNGIGHLAHILGVPHAHIIPHDVNLCPPEWVANQNGNAVWVCEPFIPMDDRRDVLEPERVLELVFAVLGSFNRSAYFAANRDVEAAGDDAWGHWVRHGKREKRPRGFQPRLAHFGNLWSAVD